MKQLMNQSGQATIESILLGVLLVSLALYVAKTAQANQYASALTEGPWQPLQGMIEDGVWAAPQTAVGMHPSLRSRHAANKPPN